MHGIGMRRFPLTPRPAPERVRGRPAPRARTSHGGSVGVRAGGLSALKPRIEGRHAPAHPTKQCSYPLTAYPDPRQKRLTPSFGQLRKWLVRMM
jgi:hypothetical protein